MRTDLILRNSFDIGPESWCSYDYHASVIAGENIFILATHEAKGGINDSGYIWVDEKRWSTDTPEDPISILPLIFYRTWINKSYVNLENAEVSVYLRGDNLQLDGAECYFWILYNETRWHYKEIPLKFGEDKWLDKSQSFLISSDESKWNNSWTKLGNGPEPLSSVVRNCESYGFSFVGFKQEVRGKFAIDEFIITSNS